MSFSATARNSAPATSSTAEDEYPVSITARALEEVMGAPPSVSGCPISPSTAMPVSTMALAAGETHSLIQRMITSASSPSATCPEAVRPAGVGSIRMAP